MNAMSIYSCTNTYIVGLVSHYPIDSVITVLYGPHAAAPYRRGKTLEPKVSDSTPQRL